MKLKFTIQYGTQWGESLHVVVSYLSLDGTKKTANLLMLTDDGTLWTLETSVVESRQHPIESFSYHYQSSVIILDVAVCFVDSFACDYFRICRI